MREAGAGGPAVGPDRPTREIPRPMVTGTQDETVARVLGASRRPCGDGGSAAGTLLAPGRDAGAPIGHRRGTGADGFLSA
ncbi:hypothetical protein GCM10010345_77540 [Streptomyces canarius]|uniref:Uncharacterized protein n=2 Tax=Streptomyces TaxID=1883 RepID=A0ABQ3D7I3_9ACTN|nr:hypothetical protein GCM10010345_77540 [Streptomyces canarius]